MPDAKAEAPRQRVFVAVPVFNNRATVRRVVEGALVHGLPVIVVDDGSVDGSASAVSDLDVEVLAHPRNLGKGAALLLAARRIRERGGTHMISLDADGQIDPADIPRLLEAIRSNPGSIVYGDRVFLPGDAPRSSTFGRRFSNFWIRATTGQSVRDSQCGFRAYPVSDLLRLDLKCRRFDFEVEALVRASWAGIPLVGVKVAVTYSPPEGRVSSFRPFMDNFRISRAYTRLFLRSMLLWPGPFPPISGRARSGELSALHPVRLVRAMLTEHSSPAELGAAAAVGLFLATLPLIGFHTIAVVLAATLLRLNRLMAFSVSHLCAPPFVPAACLMSGYYVRHGRWLSTFNADVLIRQVDQRFVDYLVGTVVLAPLIAVAGGVAVFGLAIALRKTASRAEEPRDRVRGRLAAYGSRAGIGFFRLTLRWLGLRPAYACLGFVVPYYLVFRPAVRASMRPYIARRFPGHGPVRRFVDSARLLMGFSRTLVDQGAVRVLGKEYFDVAVDDRERLRALLGSERGVVLLMAHLGPWSVILPYLDFVPKPIHLMLLEKSPGPELLPFDNPVERKRFRIIDTGAPMGGVIEAIAALSRGEIVTVMGDRPWGGRTIEAEFLGEPAPVLLTPYKLARATGSGLVLILVRKNGYRKFRIVHHDLGAPEGADPLPEDLRAREQAAAYLGHIERLLREEPFLWSNFFDFWRPGGMPADENPARATALAGDFPGEAAAPRNDKRAAEGMRGDPRRGTQEADPRRA